MALTGKIVNGSFEVKVEGLRVARKSDVIDHGCEIGEGCPTVLAGSAARPVARLGDRFKCPMFEAGKSHVGGVIAVGSPTVLVGGRPAAREQDPTVCLGEDAAGSEFADVGSGGGAGPHDEKAAACQALWAKYDHEARDMIAPAGDDHRARNHIITGAYANLYLHDKRFKWVGLAAYASKQVGCAMEHAQKMARTSYNPAAKSMAEYTYDQLGTGNKSLFLDIYPLHRFYQEQGFAKMRECANERRPPVPAAVLDAFAALDKYEQTGDKRYLREHLRDIAYHEQVDILQRDIYNDAGMQFVLDKNEGNMADYGGDPSVVMSKKPLGTPIPKHGLGYDPRGPMEPIHRGLGANPAELILTDKCRDDASGSHTVPFKTKGREHVYDVGDRMDWIGDVADYYFDHEGTSDHVDHLGNLEKAGTAHGGHYP